MNENRIDVVADALAKAWREGGAVSPLAEELWPANLAEGYQTQDALDERLDFALVGWKIGRASTLASRSSNCVCLSFNERTSRVSLSTSAKLATDGSFTFSPSRIMANVTTPNTSTEQMRTAPIFIHTPPDLNSRQAAPGSY